MKRRNQGPARLSFGPAPGRVRRTGRGCLLLFGWLPDRSVIASLPQGSSPHKLRLSLLVSRPKSNWQASSRWRPIPTDRKDAGAFAVADTAAANQDAWTTAFSVRPRQAHLSTAELSPTGTVSGGEWNPIRRELPDVADHVEDAGIGDAAGRAGQLRRRAGDHTGRTVRRAERGGLPFGVAQEPLSGVTSRRQSLKPRHERGRFHPGDGDGVEVYAALACRRAAGPIIVARDAALNGAGCAQVRQRDRVIPDFLDERLIRRFPDTRFVLVDADRPHPRGVRWAVFRLGLPPGR